MKNTDIQKAVQVDSIAKARKHPSFKKYSQEARAIILLATKIYSPGKISCKKD